MPPGDRIDPFHVHNFRMEISGTSVAGFREVSGLSFTIDPVEYREGTDIPLHTRKQPGMKKFPNIVCKRGETQDRQLWDWYARVLNGIPDRKDGAIVLQDELHQDVLRWEWTSGWICKWEGPTLNATTSDIAIESSEICVERVELK
jgi:phage tail-like protein